MNVDDGRQIAVTNEIDTGYMDILRLGVGLDCALAGERIRNGLENR